MDKEQLKEMFKDMVEDGTIKFEMWGYSEGDVHTVNLDVKIDGFSVAYTQIII